MDEPLEHLLEKTGLQWHLQLSHFVTQAVPAATVPRWAVRPQCLAWAVVEGYLEQLQSAPSWEITGISCHFRTKNQTISKIVGASRNLW